MSKKIKVDPKRMRELEIACGYEPTVEVVDRAPSLFMSALRAYVPIGRVLACIFRRRGSNIIQEHMKHHHDGHHEYNRHSYYSNSRHECGWCILWGVITGAAAIAAGCVTVVFF